MADNASATADPKDQKKDEKKPDVVLTPQEIDDSKKALLSSLWGDDATKILEPKKKDEAKPDDAKPADGDKKPDAAAAADKKPDGDKPAAADKPAADAGKPDKKPKAILKKKGAKKDDKADDEPAAAAPPPIDVEETVRRVVDERLPRQDQTPPPDASRDPSVGLNLTDEDREQLSVLEAMGKRNAAHKDLAKRTLEFWKKEEAYQTAWEQKNPGQEFDSESDEHKSWYARNEVRFDDREFRATEKAMIREEAARVGREEARKAREEDPEIQEIKAERALKKIEPAVTAAVDHATLQVLASVPEFLPEMEQGEQIVFDEDTLKRIEAKHPVLFDLINPETDKHGVLVRELELITNLPTEVYKFDVNKKVTTASGEEIRPHAEIIDTFHELEQAVARAPREKQVLNGALFITQADYNNRVQAIIDGPGGNAAKQAAIDRLTATTWQIKPTDIRDRLIAKTQRKIQSLVEKAKKWAVNGKTPDNKSVENPNPANGGKPTEKPAPPPSGATATASDNQDNTKKQTDASKKQHEEVVQVMW